MSKESGRFDSSVKAKLWCCISETLEITETLVRL